MRVSKSACRICSGPLNESLKGFTLESADLQQLDQLQKDLVLTIKPAVPQ